MWDERRAIQFVLDVHLALTTLDEQAFHACQRTAREVSAFVPPSMVRDILAADAVGTITGELSSDWFWLAAVCHVHRLPCITALSNALVCATCELGRAVPSNDSGRLLRRVARASGPVYAAAVRHVSDLVRVVSDLVRVGTEELEAIVVRQALDTQAEREADDKGRHGEHGGRETERQVADPVVDVEGDGVRTR